MIAHDGDGKDIPEKRAAARSAHLSRIVPLVNSGQILAGGAMLGEGDVVTGSAFLADFESHDALQEWLAADPYTASGVWDRFSITLIRLAVRDGRILG